MKCPNCKQKVLQKSGGGTKVRIRGPVTIDGNGLCKAKCYWCKTTVTVPLELKKAGKPTERFYVRN